MCVPWLTHMTWLIHMCDMTYSCVCHDSFICVQHAHRCATHSYVCRDSFICVPWLIHMCAMTHSYVCHDSFIRLVCRISSLLQGSFAKETYTFQELPGRSHPIPIFAKNWSAVGYIKNCMGTNGMGTNFWSPYHFWSPYQIGPHTIFGPHCMGTNFWYSQLHIGSIGVCCSVLQCIYPTADRVCWSVLQCVAVCCSVLQCVAVCCSVLILQMAVSTKRILVLKRKILETISRCCEILEFEY